MNTASENIAPFSADQKPTRQRKKKSAVWDHFTVEVINSECSRAICNHCGKSFAYITDSKIIGTSHLNRHSSGGICPAGFHNNKEKTPINPCIPVETDANISTTAMPRKRLRIRPISSYHNFEQDLCNHHIAKMSMLHEYPLNIVEHTGFIDFVQTIQPHFQMINFDTIEVECISIYLREKQGISHLLGESLGRVNLALDLWTSRQGLGYVLLTGYFIDRNWILQRRILKVVMLPFPDSEVAYNHAVIACVTDWGLDNKLFTLTIDQSFASEAVRRNLRGLLSIKNPLILDGQLLLGNCYARVLSRLAEHALDSLREIVQKVRNSVKYVTTIEVHKEKFIKLKQQLQNPSTKSLITDDRTKWDTTYHMLVAASELKEVFSCLDTSEPHYKETPSMEEWRQVEILCVHLKLLFDAANTLVAPRYPTTDIFFHEVWKIQLELTHAAMSEDPFVSNLAIPLQERFTEYWKDCSLVFAVAVVMDPRFKMKLVEFSFNKIYGKDDETWIKVVDDGIHELYREYIVLSLPAPTFVIEDSEDMKIEMTQEYSLHTAGDSLLDFEVYISEMMNSQQMKTELDQYLDEPLLPRVQGRDFDVLNWWKENMQKYPTLSKMAADILCIPVSTVASESIFDTESKKMDSHQSSLRPLTIEAIICSKDWLNYGS